MPREINADPKRSIFLNVSGEIKAGIVVEMKFIALPQLPKVNQTMLMTVESVVQVPLCLHKQTLLMSTSCVRPFNEQGSPTN